MPEDPQGASVMITLRDLWQAQQDMTRELAAAIRAVETAITRMTGHVEAIDARNASADKIHADLDHRVRLLESSSVSHATMEATRQTMITAAHRGRLVIWGALGALAAAAATAEALLQHFHP